MKLKCFNPSFVEFPKHTRGTISASLEKQQIKRDAKLFREITEGVRSEFRKKVEFKLDS